jgi:hypothetical protein
MTPERPLHVAADLSIDVDGVPVQVRASGSDVHVVAGDVRRLLAGVRVVGGAARQRAPGRTELRKVAGTLADHGLTARLDGPSGRVATLGARVDSRTGAALIGTERARLHPIGVVRAVGPPRVVAAAFVVAAFVAGAFVAGAVTSCRRPR